jgi:Ca2+-binding EF-hand superfamily protein
MAMQSTNESAWGREVGRGILAGLLGSLALAIGVGGDLGAAEADLVAAFESLDETGDGMVTREEFQRQKTQIFFAALDAAGADQTLRPEDVRLTPEAFAAADIDGDGLLSGAEFVQAPFLQFDTLDLDGDQQISLEEFREVIGPILVD